MLVVLAAVAAALLGLLGPRVLARVPEPHDADPAKPSYAALASAGRLGPALAVAAATVTVVVGLVLEQRPLVLVWALLAPTGLLLAHVDARTHLLPRRLVLPLNAGVVLLVVPVAALERDPDLLVRALLGGAALFCVLAGLWLVSPRSLGYGDVRLSPALGVALAASGWAELVAGVYAGFVLAAVLGLLLGRLGRVDVRRLAFGPYLVAGAVVGVLWPPLVLGA